MYWHLAIVDGWTLLVEAGPDSHCGLRYPRAGWEVRNFLIEKLAGCVRAKNCQNKKTKLILTSRVCLPASYGFWLVVAGSRASKFPLWAEIFQGRLGGT